MTNNSIHDIHGGEPAIVLISSCVPCPVSMLGHRVHCSSVCMMGSVLLSSILFYSILSDGIWISCLSYRANGPQSQVSVILELKRGCSRNGVRVARQHWPPLWSQ